MAVRFPLLEEFLNYLRFLDSPGTYIMMMVIGMILLPFYFKSISNHLKTPEDYYLISFEKKFFMGLVVISFLILWGLYNFLRFVQ